MKNIPAELSFNNETSIVIVFLSFFLTLICSLIISLIYKNRNASSLIKSEIINVLPFISLSTFLVISVVKSSLALSLGLVGALSIIRFRTPIKSPEELGYIFFALSIGIGFAANQIMITLFCFICISLFLFIRQTRKKLNEYNLLIEYNSENIDYEEISKILSEVFQEIYLVKLEKLDNNKILIVYKVEINGSEQIFEVQNNLKNYKDITFSFYEVDILI